MPTWPWSSTPSPPAPSPEPCTGSTPRAARSPPRVFRGSTHALGLGEAIELARALGRLPGRLLVYGVEGADFGTGEGLSPAVTAALGPLADELLRKARVEPAAEGT